jgi:hypothetical protein
LIRAEPLPDELTVSGFELTRIDDYCLEAHIEQGQDLAELMSQLHGQGHQYSQYA